MKSLLKTLVLFVFFSLVLNCSNDDDSGNSSQEFSPELLNGTWSISLFTDENENRTTEFTGYEFTFNVEEERAVITYNEVSETALIEVFIEDNLSEDTWVVYLDFDNIDNPGDADLNDLVEDWIVTSVNGNATVIEFEELYSNNTPEILHLSKVSDDN
ncbi:hypothetical protein EYD45_14255 [Hyunsoonleella flava]|uniref:Lipocalin-like domain-containing protein n=1 Tax=Hyunsoonleella flava TaxID=2527939 RepID=A0A4Q9FAZ5_9FLAO|nr:hypothetical protein [Hyunsoonleella flava]TBN00426.1 hypothetical protein EYD45_14255 [Hyunsoonleella flava]